MKERNTESQSVLELIIDKVQQFVDVHQHFNNNLCPQS